MPQTRNWELECLPPIDVAPGVVLHSFHNPAKPEGSRDKYWTELECTGEHGAAAFEVPTHWHKLHDEWWQVLEGRINLYSGGEEFVMSEGDPERKSPRGTVHGLKAFKGERVVLRESTTPTAPFKEAQGSVQSTSRSRRLNPFDRFFRDIFYQGQPRFWYLMRNFVDGDTYPHPGLKFQWIDQVFMLFFGTLARLFVSANQMGNITATSESRVKKDL